MGEPPTRKSPPDPLLVAGCVPGLRRFICPQQSASSCFAPFLIKKDLEISRHRPGSCIPPVPPPPPSCPLLLQAPGTQCQVPWEHGGCPGLLEPGAAGPPSRGLGAGERLSVWTERQFCFWFPE